MRGKAAAHGVSYGKYRITPAYAGKRTRESSRTSSSRDHPRLCGEKFHSVYR